MAMGTRKQREKQEDIWIAHTELASAPGHPFYQRLNELLEAEQFDQFVEERCAKFYRSQYGRPSLTPGIYIRSLAIGGFVGAAALCGDCPDGGYAGPLDPIADAAADRCGDASGSLLLGVEPAGGWWAAAGPGDWHGCHDAGGQRGHAFDCAAGDGRGL